MLMVQRVEISQSPVCSMECMVYVGSNTRFSMAMLNRYPSMLSYFVSGSSKETSEAYRDLSMPRSSNRWLRSSAMVAMYFCSASPSSRAGAEEEDSTARRGRAEARREEAARPRAGDAAGDAPRATVVACACIVL